MEYIAIAVIIALVPPTAYDADMDEWEDEKDDA